MILEAEKLKAEEEDYNKKVRAINALQDYAYELSNVIKDNEISAMISASDKKKMEDAIEKATKWLDGKQIEETDEFECNTIKIRIGRICNPIIVNICKGWAEIDSQINNRKYEWLMKLTK